MLATVHSPTTGPLAAPTAERAGALVSGTGVAVIATTIGRHGGPTALDTQVAHDVLEHRTPWLTAAAHTLTFLGSEVVVGALALLLLLALVRRQRWSSAALVAVGMAGSVALTVLVKLAFARPRPPALDRLGPVDHSFSFPSGHTLNSAVFLGLVVLVAAGLPALARRAVTVAAGCLAVGIGVSRVYLGYHWATDVLAAWLIAIAWLSVTTLGVRHLRPAR
jgi:membrane-associated phospholipid phosphatase